MTSDNTTRNALVMGHLRLGRWIARRYQRMYPYLPVDWEQEAMLFLVKAAQKFNQGQSKFTTYATTYLKGMLLAVARKAQKEWIRRETIPEEFDQLPGRSDDPTAHIVAQEITELLRAAIANLPTAQRRAAENRLTGRSDRKLAEAIGISAATVTLAVGRAVNNLRRVLQTSLGDNE